jgi:AcrR family transcriptional regulator
MVKSDPSDRGPRRLPSPERRAAILRAALPRFAAGGYSGTTTRDLARAAGVTEPVLYRHFPSKADLFAEVLRGVEERILERLAEAVRGVEGVRGRLSALAAALEPTVTALADEFRVLNGAAATRSDVATAAAVRATYARLGAFLAQAVRTKDLRRGLDPVTVGHFLLEVGLGASLVRPLGVPVVARTGYGPQVVRLLAFALEARPATAR